MFNYIYGIKFGKLGVLVDWGTREEFFSREWFEPFIGRGISRIGPCISFKYPSHEQSHYVKGGIWKKGAEVVICYHPLNCWHFKHLQDAENFMTWLLGGSDSDIHPLNEKKD